MTNSLHFSQHTKHTKHRATYIPLLWLAAAFGVCMLCAPSIRAQNGTLKGKVMDVKSKEALSARVYIASVRRGAAAKPDGTYSFDVPAGTYDVQVSFTSYKGAKRSVTITAGQTTEQNFELQEDLVRTAEAVVLGTRRSDRTVVEAPVPVDVIPAAEMRQSGLTEVNQMIQFAVPSFNFPRPSIADGSDHVRPATIRGLGPDQVLVLVNGKRRHSSALINVNGTVGRGSAGVDMNALPGNAIDRIEVLRDGAAAQYGSDAIAGVINIILRNDNALNLSGQVGQCSVGDGKVIDLTGDYGFALPNGGGVHISGEYRDRGYTNRAAGDFRSQYSAAQLATNPSLKNPVSTDASTWPQRFRLGDAATTDGGGMINANLPISQEVNLYAFGGYTIRKGESAANFRVASNANNVPSIFPDGFLPYIKADIYDLSFAVGSKGDIGGWTYDLSESFGRNNLRYDVTNSVNASLGTSSPTQFYAGTLIYTQNSLNFDIFRAFNAGLAAPLNVAFGAEFRSENYKIQAGDSASWVNQPGNVGAKGITINKTPAGGAPAAGAQGFPGYQPKDLTDASRNNISLYADLETKFTEQWLVSVAARFENYSDFGSTVTGKFATRYEFAPGFAFRGGVSTGFRAPSLQQTYYSATATNFIGGVPFDISSFPVTSAAGRLMGAQDLKAEKSLNISGGFALEPVQNLSITADYYNISITDRIVFTGNFTGDSVLALLARNGILGVAGGRYFTNAIDTRTNGVEVVARYGLDLADAGLLRLTAGFSWNQTEVTRVSATPSQLIGVGANLFDHVERGRFEHGQPQTNLQLTLNYNLKSFQDLAIMLRTVRFGEFTSFDNTTVTNPTTKEVIYIFDQTFSAKWVSDIDISFALIKGLRLSFGMNNIFDVYPDKFQEQRLVTNPFTGAFVNSGSLAGSTLPYPGGSPFGFNGRFLYGKISFTF